MASEWTSVKEQLPKSGTKVLCLYDGAKTRIFDATYSARSGWTGHDYDNVETREDVDYWQPLPKPLKTFQVGK